MSGYPGYGGYGPPPPQASDGGYFPPNTQPLATVPPFVAPYPPGPIPSVPPPGTFPPPHPTFGYPMQPPPAFPAFAPPQQSVPPQQFSGFAGPSAPSHVSPPVQASVPPQTTTSAPTTSAPAAASVPPPLPPAGSQQFGQGAPPGYQYQYSMCTGKRKALLIGINYFGQRGQLRGCINDVRNMSGYLVSHFGYKREDMVILTDDQQNPISQPTKQNILRAMHWLVKDAKPNDSLFFHYSGHGGQTKDLDGDEADGYDEVIYPVDFRQTSHITDDEMHRIMVQPLPAGVRLTAIFDSCHSATALDLPYVYSTQGMIKEPNLAREAGQGLLNVVSACARNDFEGAGDHLVSVFKKAATGEEAHRRSLMTKTSAADVVMFSGSKDNQTSADTIIASQATGAMSWAFISALKKNPQQSYMQLLNSIRDELETRYTQRPQLSSSHPISASKTLVAGA